MLQIRETVPCPQETLQLDAFIWRLAFVAVTSVARDGAVNPCAVLPDPLCVF